MAEARRILGNNIRLVKKGPKNPHTRKMSSFIKVKDQYSRKERYFSCERKSSYCSKARALRYARKCEEARGGHIRVYECPICGKYHLTHTMKKDHGNH